MSENPYRTSIPGHGHNCTCHGCRAARKRYDAWREADRLRNGPRLIPAEPTGAHVRQHLAAGWTPNHLAHLYGITRPNVRTLATGAQATVTRTVAARIAAVWPTFDNAPDNVFVPSWGVHRRLQALRCLGWTTDALQDRLGDALVLRPLIHRPAVHIGTHRTIADLYAELENTPGPSEITRTRARKAGYLPPAAWDDIDDPEPPQADVIAIDGMTERMALLVEDVRALAAAGTGLTDAAARLGYPRPKNLERALHRLDRGDLAARLRAQDWAVVA